MRFAHLVLVIGLLLGAAGAAAAEPVPATLYKNPWCGCCTEYGAYLERHGFAVTVEEVEDLGPIKRAAGVPDHLEGCHTLKVGGYVVEGHVPVDVLTRLLRERPDLAGIALPGMPAGSPGMGGTKAGPFTIHGFGPGGAQVYAVE